jgi:hypothetical protein
MIGVPVKVLHPRREVQFSIFSRTLWMEGSPEDNWLRFDWEG